MIIRVVTTNNASSSEIIQKSTNNNSSRSRHCSPFSLVVYRTTLEIQVTRRLSFLVAVVSGGIAAATMFSFPGYSTNASSHTEEKNHPWQETLQKLEDERYSHHTNAESDKQGHGIGQPSQAPPPVDSLPPRQPAGQHQYSGESARRNRDHYMYASYENNTTSYNIKILKIVSSSCELYRSCIYDFTF